MAFFFFFWMRTWFCRRYAECLADDCFAERLASRHQTHDAHTTHIILSVLSICLSHSLHFAVFVFLGDFACLNTACDIVGIPRRWTERSIGWPDRSKQQRPARRHKFRSGARARILTHVVHSPYRTTSIRFSSINNIILARGQYNEIAQSSARTTTISAILP